MGTSAIEVVQPSALELIAELQAELAELKNGRAASSMMQQLFQPQDMNQAWDLAKIVADSDFAPKDYRGKPGNCLIAMQYGADLGIPFLQAIQNISVVNGRPSLWGHLYWALVTNHRDFVDAEEEIGAKGAKITLHRRGRKPVVREFTEEMARTAGLLGKDSYKNYPHRMYQWRVRHWAGDDLFPEATRGLIPREIAEDYPGVTIEGERPMLSESTQQTNGTSSAVITEDQAREFGKAWKASGYDAKEDMAAIKAALKRIAGVESSLKIPADKYEAAMEWARTPNPNRKTNGAKAAGGAVSEDEREARAGFDILGWDDKTRQRFIDQYGSDWKKVRAEVANLIAKRDQGGE
jgi:hypothetical protein